MPRRCVATLVASNGYGMTGGIHAGFEPHPASSLRGSATFPFQGKDERPKN